MRTNTVFQCPTSGFFLFYSRIYNGSITDYELFQCPTSGFFLFYDNFINQLLQRYNVSMPYLGLLPFLLAGRRGIVSKENRMFQCPTSGFFLFYMNVQIILYTISEEFQCPTSGFFLFYSTGSLSELKKVLFQCPTSGFLLFYLRLFQR